MIYASTGSERSADDKLTGRILVVENILEFKLQGVKEKEKIVVLHDFKNKAGSPLAFQWNGRWSKEDKDRLWNPQLKASLGYSSIY